MSAALFSSSSSSSSSSLSSNPIFLEDEFLFDWNQPALRVANPEFLHTSSTKDKQLEQELKIPLAKQLAAMRSPSRNNDVLEMMNYLHYCLTCYYLHAPLVVSPGILFATAIASFFDNLQRNANKTTRGALFLGPTYKKTDERVNLTLVGPADRMPPKQLVSALQQRFLVFDPQILLPAARTASSGEQLVAVGSLLQSANEFIRFIAVRCGFPEFILLGTPDDYAKNAQQLSQALDAFPRVFDTFKAPLKKGVELLMLVGKALESKNVDEITRAARQMLEIEGPCGSGHTTVSGLLPELVAGHVSDNTDTNSQDYYPPAFELNNLLYRHNSSWQVIQQETNKPFRHSTTLCIPTTMFQDLERDNNAPEKFAALYDTPKETTLAQLWESCVSGDGSSNKGHLRLFLPRLRYTVEDISIVEKQ